MIIFSLTIFIQCRIFYMVYCLKSAEKVQKSTWCTEIIFNSKHLHNESQTSVRGDLSSSSDLRHTHGKQTHIVGRNIYKISIQIHKSLNIQILVI